MSGHSKWANIKRRKESQDQKKGQTFSKLAKAIQMAVKEGGSASPDANARLKMIIDQARNSDMPKENIKRAIDNAINKTEAIENLSLEGYGPFGVAVIVSCATDNRQRTIQEIKSIFTRNGGNLAEPGSVAFQFDRTGLVETGLLTEDNLLELLDIAQDFEQSDDTTYFYLPPEKIEELKQKLENLKIKIDYSGIIMKPKNLMTLDQGKVGKTLAFLEELEDHEDVQDVYSNVNAEMV